MKKTSGATGPRAVPPAATAPRRGLDRAAMPALLQSLAPVNCSGVQVRSSPIIPPAILSLTHTHSANTARVHTVSVLILPGTTFLALNVITEY